MIRVYAYFFLFRAEWILADLEGFQLVVALEIWPAPHAAVYYVRETFAMRYL